MRSATSSSTVRMRSTSLSLGAASNVRQTRESRVEPRERCAQEDPSFEGRASWRGANPSVRRAPAAVDAAARRTNSASGLRFARALPIGWRARGAGQMAAGRMVRRALLRAHCRSRRRAAAVVLRAARHAPDLGLVRAAGATVNEGAAPLAVQVVLHSSVGATTAATTVYVRRRGTRARRRAAPTTRRSRRKSSRSRSAASTAPRSRSR